MTDFVFETPSQLMRRLKLGREEFCQRLLTSLILRGPYPRWNTRSTPSPEGLALLRRMHERCFSDGWPDDGDPVFVDELELAPRLEAERGGAPDYGVLWQDRVWLIELKTERASHRADQVPYYFELAHHHHPDARVDLTYLTPPMEAPHEVTGDWERYAHLTWDQVADLVKEVWPDPRLPGQREVVDGLLEAIGGLHEPARTWRARLRPEDTAEGPPADLSSESGEAPADEAIPPEPDGGVKGALGEGLGLAEQTAADHKQRALEASVGDLEELLQLRLELRDAIAASPPGSPLRHVRPWIWRPESSGAPMTPSGAERGMEIRLSRYERPVT